LTVPEEIETNSKLGKALMQSKAMVATGCPVLWFEVIAGRGKKASSAPQARMRSSSVGYFAPLQVP